MPEPAFHIVLVEPEIPPNTGNIGRLCVATGACLHLVKPLGFEIDAKAVRRAGLDYWEHLDWHLWENFPAVQAAAAPEARFYYLSTKAQRLYWDAEFRTGDYLVFGRETKGLPESLLAAAAQDARLRLPMRPAARSLNLATAVGAVLYEAVRQVSR